MNNTHSLRIKFILFALVLASLTLVARLYFLQIVNGEELSQKADRQYTSPNSTVFARGTIYFETKDGILVPAATLKSGYTVAINPQILKDHEVVYQKISSLVEVEEEDFLKKANQKERTYIEIGKRVPEEQAKKIEELKIPGLRIYKEKWRYYPGGKLAAHVLGFLAHGDGGYKGQYGLERYYDDVLSRKEGSSYVNFFAEIFSNINDISEGKSLEGDIVTTIEPNVQAFLESELQKTNEKWNSEYTGGIIINPQNGEIYAMATYPAFDPNNFSKEESVKIFSNPMVENVYEMGSIIKALTMSSALDVGAVTATTTYYDAGYMVYNGSRISNFDGKGRGVVDMQTVLSQSLNTGSAFAEQKVGNKRFAEYLKNFGIGVETGVDLPNETFGLTSNLESPRDIEYVTASFGQGIAMTPIATVRALSTLANGGTLINPHLVKKVNYKVGGSKETFVGVGKRVIKPETSEEISRMMVWSVDNALRNGTMKIPNYSVAVKTGTAQMAKEDGRGYYEDKFLHSFFGYFPAYHPKFLVFLFTVNPRNNIRYSSETLTDPFFEVTKFLINYYELPPDR